MAAQSVLHIFQAVSMIVLWGIVIWLAGIHISEYTKKRIRMKALVLDGQGGIRDEHVLGKQKELLIGKSTPARMVNIDFSDSAYAGSIQGEHASFIRYGSCWYICARTEQGMVGLKQKGDDTVYKLRTNIPYRVQRGDIVYISYEKIVIQ